jgi:hypothetical protein
METILFLETIVHFHSYECHKVLHTERIEDSLAAGLCRGTGDGRGWSIWLAGNKAQVSPV